MVLPFHLRGILLGVPATGVVFFSVALRVIAHFDGPNSSLGLWAIVGRTLSSPLFWVLGIAAFAASYHFVA